MNSASVMALALRQRLPVVVSFVVNYYRAVSEPEDLACAIASTVELPVLVFVLNLWKGICADSCFSSIYHKRQWPELFASQVRQLDTRIELTSQVPVSQQSI